MTAIVDIVNRALQTIGTRTTVTATELVNQTSNEAIQANFVVGPTRDELIRMAPWNCATNYNPLTYITSVPGTPENNTGGFAQWQKGLPAPPWAYEYQYPVDCLRPLWIIPQFATGFSGGIPITTAVTGGAAAFWGGPPVRYKVSVDQFFGVTAASVVAGGTGHAVGDVITLASTPSGQNPIGAPAQLVVATAIAGVITSVTVVNQISGEATPIGGSYFAHQTNPVAQGSSTGVGIGATFNLTYAPKGDQRTILTNQENASMAYLRQVTDPNVMDPLFVQAWVAILGARLVFALTGSVQQANIQIQQANKHIVDARTPDGNEGLTINDVTPDWIRYRGIAYPEWAFSPNAQFDWGPLFTQY